MKWPVIRREVLFLMLILLQTPKGITWEGTWESNANYYRLSTCMGSNNHWQGLIEELPTQRPILLLNGTLQQSDTFQAEHIIGTCSLPRDGQVEYELRDGNSERVFPGGAVHFVPGGDVVYPFDLKVVSEGGEVLFEALDVVLGSDVLWRNDFSLMEKDSLKVNVIWGNSTSFIQFVGVGPSLLVWVEPYALSASCNSPNPEKSVKIYFPFFTPGSELTICPPKSEYLWIGSWQLYPPVFGEYWYVCPTYTGGLISSFVHSQGDDYFSRGVTLGSNFIQGSFVSNTNDNMHGEFHFNLNNETSFSGFFLVNSNKWNVKGTISSTEYYSCSDIFTGFWMDREHSSSMTICADRQYVKGAYFGGGILLYGWITNSFYYWYLRLDVYNTITEEKSTLSLVLNDDNTELLNTLNSNPFATFLETSDGCPDTLPFTWGIYSLDTSPSLLLLCTGNGNSVYGRMNDGSMDFTGKLVSENEINGETKAGEKFVWEFENDILDKSKNTILASYSVEGASIFSLMTKISNKVTLSQCNGFVLVSTFTGTWLISNSSYLYFCQVSDSGFEGRMDTFYFSGFYLNGYLHGTYIKVDGTSGNWTAWSDLSEKEIALSIDDNNTMNGTKYSRISSSSECGGITFWKNSFGLLDETHPLGGCFFVCFEKVITFNIIFAYSELFGNGTMDISSGTLMGKLNNGWIFNLSIAANKTVDAIFIDREGSSFMLNYIPCDGTKYIWTTTDSLIFTLTPTKAYPNCVPKRFEPTINLPSIPFQINGTELNLLSTRKGGIDMTFDGEMTIVSSFDHNFIFKNNLGNWEIGFEFPQNSLQYVYISNDVSSYIGSPVAITNTHAFVIYGPNVTVFQKFSNEWKQIGILEPPCSCEPLYVIKSFSAADEFCVVEVTWYNQEFNLALYNVSFGMVDFTPFYTVNIGDYFEGGKVFSVAIHPSWFVYTTLYKNVNNDIKVHYCALSLEGVSSNCSNQYMNLAQLSDRPNYDIGVGFSISVNRHYLFIGYPSSQNNSGSVYVYKYKNNVWRLSEVLHPPESSFNQLFGRNLVAKENDLIILKAIDSSVKPLSMALFTYALSSGKWIPKFKMVSEEWPSTLSSSLSLKKRQYYTTPHYHESTLYWSMSNNGTLFITSPSFNSFSHVWYTCPNGFWGLNCSNLCPCKLNSSCTSDILGYRCLCSPNTWGYNCENKCRECNASRCDDGATGTGICLCNSSQYGPICNLCTCVNGLCDSGPNGTGFCSCNFGWTGDSCEILQNQLSIPAIIAISVSVSITVILLVATGIYLCCRKEKYYDMSDLPEEIIWYFDVEKTNSETGWMQEKGFLAKNVMEDKKYKKDLDSLLKNLDGGKLAWEKAYAIFNRTLINNFLGFRKVTASRHQDSPGLFKKKYIQNEMRDWVMEQYNLVTKGYEWNTSLELPILPVIHGTSVSVAKSICSTGFAALSSLDQGFYGKGIYATSSCLYALPYFGPKPKPAILICLATPGNVYPIIEDHQGKSSWLGKPIANGFQSHYVVTARDGSVVNEKSELFYDEFVFPAEGQLVPIYVVLVKQKALENLLEGHQKLIADC